MNPQKELQQIQDLSLKLDIPIWKNSIELPFRDKKNIIPLLQQKNATDIHFLPTPQNTYNIQIRIDGKLQPYKAEVIKGVVFKVKLLSQMDVAKTRFPQDGYMNFQNKKGKKFDVRVATRNRF